MAELITTISYGGPSAKRRNLDSAKTMCAPCGCSRQVLPTTALSYSSYCTFPLAISAGSKPRLRLPKYANFLVSKGCPQRLSRHRRCTSVQAACGGDSMVGTKKKDGCQLPTDCSGKCTSRKSMQNDMENWFRFVKPHARVFLLCSGIACLVWHGRTKAAFAALHLPNVAGKTKAAWPKILQVLNVFKEQGLLLSVLLGLSAFFSMAETSITTLWPWKVRELAEKEDEGGVFQLLRKDVTRFLTTILIGTTISNIAATALVTDAATALFGEAGVTAATGVMTVVVLLLTEIAPKSIAVHNATEVARFVVRPVAWLSVILYPVGRVVTVLSTAMLKAFGLKSSGEPFVTEEELKLMLRGAELSGAIEEEEQDMIENVLEIKDTFVREVMTPLVDVVAVDAGATLLEFRNFWVKHQYSRVPAFERRIDNIVGICYAMDMLDYVDQAELLQTLTVGKIAHRPAYFVPDSMSVWNLLREFRIRKVHMAIVLNEYGGAVGIVTLEDVVEEIVGEIFDENDSKEEIRKKTGYVVQRADGVFDVDANTSIEDLAEALQVKFPEEHHYETVSGFVCEAFGYIPRTGESTKLVLRKEDPAEDHGEGDSESQDEKKEKFQIYKLEILAGNARKVGAARFEVLETSKLEETSGHLPRFVRRAWGQQCEENKESEGAEGQTVAIVWDGKPIPMAKTADDLCSTSEETEQESNLVDAEYEVTAVSTDVVGSRPDWDRNAVRYEKSTEMDTDDEFESSTANAMAYEKYLERRRQRRRRQADEASAELSRRRAELKRREAERAMLNSKKSRSEQKSSDGEKQ